MRFVLSERMGAEYTWGNCGLKKKCALMESSDNINQISQSPYQNNRSSISSKYIVTPDMH